jgi:drug/metabolite transporter (DMT)-like permease
VPSGISALLMASVSLWTALLEWLRGSSNRPSRLVIWSLLAGFLGITALVIHPEALSGSGGAPLGAGIALIGAFSWAAGTVLTRRMPLTQSTAVNSGMQMVAGGAMLLLLGLATEPLPTIAALSWQPVTAMLFLTLIGSLVGFTCYLWLLSVVPATQVATYAYVNPIVAVLLGWAVAGERLTLRSLAASAVVLVAVIVIVSSRKRTASDHPAAKSPYSVDRVTARV